MDKYKQNLHVSGNNVYSYDTHVATIDGNELIIHGYYSMTTSKHVNYVAAEMGLEKVHEDKKKPSPSEEEGMSHLKTVGLIASLASIMCATPGEQDEAKKRVGENRWKQRMLKAGLETKGLSFPGDFDKLPEEEKQRRLDAAIEVIR